MCQRSNDRDLVRVIGQSRKVLTDLNAWNASRDRIERPSYFGRRVGLEVKRIKLAGPAPHKQKDASLGRFGSNAVGNHCSVSGMEAVRKTEPQAADGSRMQKPPAIMVSLDRD